MVRIDAKRVFDLTLALPMAILSLPVQAAVAVAVVLKLGRPVVFSQQRPGLHGKPFTMRKFRTMLAVDASLGLVNDESRMTGLGQWLRSTSLDELPALWNVIRGDMSMVGPRPLLMQYLTRYSPEQAHRHDVKPGLTGLAQVSGRNTISWDEKLSLDVQYTRSKSFRLDILILWQTLECVILRSGVEAPGSVTMPEFLGSRAE